MNKILIINSGSSSLKFQMFNQESKEIVCSGVIDRIGISESYIEIEIGSQKLKEEIEIENHQLGITRLLEILKTEQIIEDLKEITKIGHRIVQGGEIFKTPVLVGDIELEQIKDLAVLAPLHNYTNAKGIEIFRDLIPSVKNIAVFDTEFHQTMPEESYLYGVPINWYQEHKIRRYGMHGTSYKYVTNKIAEMKNQEIENLNLIICHLGNGASLAAIKQGKCLQTSMGLTPLEGIIMGTRSGSLDPAIYSYVQKELGYSTEEITDILNKESGMLGLTGVSSDFRDIKKELDQGNKQVQTAVSVYVTRIIEYIGAYYARLKSVDAIVFTAGIGENSPWLRTKIIEELKFLGIELDDEANEKNEITISLPKSKIDVLVVPTNEEYQIFLETEKF